MKKILLSGLGLIVTCFGFSQTNNSPNLEVFEQWYLPDCWQSVDIDENDSIWTHYFYAENFQPIILIPNNPNPDDLPPNANGIMASWSWTPADGGFSPDNFLILPQLDIQPGEHLSYRIRPLDDNYTWENYGVFLSTTGSDPEDFTVNLFEETLSIYGWEDRFIDLSEYEGQQVYIAFRHYNCFDVFLIGVDDVQYPTTVEDCYVAASIDENISELNFHIYPNPSDAWITISSDTNEEIVAEVI